MLQRKQWLSFLGGYVALRVFSYFFGPETPLQSQHLLNTLLTGAILLSAVYWLIKKDIRGWYIVALEIILGGSGGFFSLLHLSLRTWLLIAALAIFVGQKIKSRTLVIVLTKNTPLTALIGGLLSLALLQALQGFINHHDTRLIISDLVPYLFFAYYFPLQEIITDKNFSNLAINALGAAIVGNTLFMLLTFTGFSSGMFQLQDAYYHWFRDVAEGKITELPFHFYRLVLNEHLLLIPLFLSSINRWLNKDCNLFLALLLISLSINITRIYLVAVVVGLLALFNRSEWQRWLLGSLATLLFFGAVFTSLHLLASRGASLGWEIFGIRLQSIVSPSIEDSSLSRLLLLPKIKEKIKSHPIIGEGIGATVSVYSPVFKKIITTPHFDWGYLEIIDELGAVGLLVWGAIIVFLFRSYQKKQLPRWQLASFLALLIINLTSPALFHVLGVIWITLLLALSSNRLGDASS